MPDGVGLGDLYWRIRGDDGAQLEKDISAATARAGKAQQRQGEKLTRQATVPLVALAAAGVSAFGNINSGLREVITLTGETGDQADETFAGFRDNIESLSGSLGVAQSELVDGLYTSLSAGVPKDNVFAFLETATKAAIAGVGTTEEAVDLATSSLNAWGLEASEANRVLDVWFGTIRAGKTTLPELSAAIGRLAPAANLAGVSIEETGAALSTLTAGGLSTSQAATQIVAALGGIQQPTEGITAVFNELGFASGQAAIEQEGLQFALKAVSDAAAGDNGQLKKLLGSTEAVGAAAVIAGSGYEKFQADLEAAGNSAGAAGLAFDEIDKSRNLERLVNELRNLGIEFGETLFPLVEGAAEIIGSLLDVIGLLPDGALIGFGGAVAAAGPLLNILGRLQTAGVKLPGVLASAFSAGPILAGAAAIGVAVGALSAFRAAQAEDQRHAQEYADELARATGLNLDLTDALAVSKGALDEQAEAFGNVTGSGLEEFSARGQAFLSTLERFGGREIIGPLEDLGVTIEDLTAISSRSGPGLRDVYLGVGDLGDALEDLDRNNVLSSSGLRDLENALRDTWDAMAEGDRTLNNTSKAVVEQGQKNELWTQSQIDATLALDGIHGSTIRWALALDHLNSRAVSAQTALDPNAWAEAEGFMDSAGDATEGLAGDLEALTVQTEAQAEAAAEAAEIIREEWEASLARITDVIPTVGDAIRDLDDDASLEDFFAGLIEDQESYIAFQTNLNALSAAGYDDLVNQILEIPDLGLASQFAQEAIDAEVEVRQGFERQAEAVREGLDKVSAAAATGTTFSQVPLADLDAEVDRHLVNISASFDAAADARGAITVETAIEFLPPDEALAVVQAEIESTEMLANITFPGADINADYQAIISELEAQEAILQVEVRYQDPGFTVPSVDIFGNNFDGFADGSAGVIGPNVTATVGEFRPELLKTDSLGRATVLPNSSALTADNEGRSITVDAHFYETAELTEDPGQGILNALFRTGN